MSVAEPGGFSVEASSTNRLIMSTNSGHAVCLLIKLSPAHKTGWYPGAPALKLQNFPRGEESLKLKAKQGSRTPEHLHKGSNETEPSKALTLPLKPKP